MVLDGWGYREEAKDNAIARAKKPNWDRMWRKYPHATLSASGESVGLPEGQMGNSEVGHMTIGAGKIIDTDLVRIHKAIKNGDFDKNPVFAELFEHVKKNESAIHAMGLLSDGGVHSHISHLFTFLKLAKNSGISKIFIHVFLDGRDTPPESGKTYLQKLENFLEELGAGEIATISGRYYAMDRDKNWDRIKLAEEAIFEGKSERVVSNKKPSEFAGECYKNGETDEFIKPSVFSGFLPPCPRGEGESASEGGGRKIKINRNDAIFFFNFRADRAREISAKILEKAEKENLYFATMTDYGEEIKSHVVFPPVKIETTLAKEISNASLAQAHIAETEKFAHATYFLNGGEEKPYPKEEQMLIPSRRDVATHDLAPEMKAPEITAKALEYLDKGTDFIFINFANADMVGHTANVPAIIKAVEVVDECLGKLENKITEKGGVMLITADHGNAEINIDPETGVPHTAHTTSPVPAILTDKSLSLKNGGNLSDIAPTILELMKLPRPEEMTGRSLL